MADDEKEDGLVEDKAGRQVWICGKIAVVNYRQWVTISDDQNGKPQSRTNRMLTEPEIHMYLRALDIADRLIDQGEHIEPFVDDAFTFED